MSINGLSQGKIFEEIIYKDFKYIEYFNYITVFVKSEHAEEIGLKSEELTKYAKLRFKNNFSSIEYKDKPIPFYATEIEKKKAGRIWFDVWAVGQDYPIAYHIQCKSGSIDYFWKSSYLGYGSKENVLDTIKELINELIEELAIDFFTVRGEL